MLKRKEKIEQLLERFQALRRSVVLSSAGSMATPRITPSQWGVLLFLQQYSSCTVKDIAQTLHITSSAATQLIDGLVRSGYIMRSTDPADRRVALISLSKKTKKQVIAMKKNAIAKFVTVFKALSDKELDQYCRLTKKLVQKSTRTT